MSHKPLEKRRKIPPANANFINNVVRYLHVEPCYTKQFFLLFATQQTLRCKLQEKLLRVTWPLVKRQKSFMNIGIESEYESR